ncbi:MAG: S41 family peptidase [Pseudomonadota bacterium]
MNFRTINNARRETARGSLWAVAALALIAACSDGSSPAPQPPAPPPPPPPPPPPSGPTFTPGVFEPASEFIARCENPRSGVDIEGNPFPDVQGSTLLENFWLRSWTNETYLFNDEVDDRDPNDFDDRLDYFDILRTFRQTASGRDVDEFHFTQPTDEFLAERNSAPSATYGARIVAFSTTPPRDFRILFTEPDSPASEVVAGVPQLARGTRILEVDGVDLVNGGADQAEIDILNAGLFPATPGEVHDFVVQDAGATTSRAITLVSANLSSNPVNRTRVISTPTGPVGYILLNTFGPFSSEEQIATAITEMDAAGVTDLVLDLRYNGGGLLATASQLAFGVAGPGPTTGRVFEQLRFNDDAGQFNPVTGAINDPLPFFTTGLGFTLPDGAPLDSLGLSRVFVLSTESTCSASESVINGLRGIGLEVVLIGGTTCGKPFGFFPTDNCGVTYFTIQFQGTNDVGFGDYADGFIPDNSSAAFGVRAPGCVVADDINTELGEETEAMLSAALQFRADGTCPTPPPTSVATASEAPIGLAVQAPPEPTFAETNRDLRMPQ